MSDDRDSTDESNKKEPRTEMSDKKEKVRDNGSSDENSLDNQAAESGLDTDIDSLQKQLSESGALLNSYKDQLLRLAADFENFKKRVEIDKTEFVKFSNEKIIKDLLPILDDFSRAMSNGKSNPEFESFYKGIEMIYQKLYKILEDKGLQPIESVGKEFDVMYHDVLMQMPKTDVAPHTIVEEVERGYTLHGKVIKHAKVIVAAEAPDMTDDKKEN